MSAGASAEASAMLCKFRNRWTSHFRNLTSVDGSFRWNRLVIFIM